MITQFHRFQTQQFNNKFASSHPRYSAPQKSSNHLPNKDLFTISQSPNLHFTGNSPLFRGKTDATQYQSLFADGHGTVYSNQTQIGAISSKPTVLDAQKAIDITGARLNNIELKGTLFDNSSQLHNTLLSAGNTEVKGTLVDLSKNIDCTNSKVLCPELNFTLFDFSRNYTVKDINGGTILQKSDLEPLKAGIDHIRAMGTHRSNVKLRNAAESLRLATISNDNYTIKHNLSTARRDFFTVKESAEPISLENRIAATLGNIQCLELLGDPEGAKKEQLKFLATLAQREDALFTYLENQNPNKLNKKLLAEELLYIQKHGGQNLKSLYDADRKFLKDGRLAENFLDYCEKKKDFRGVYFYCKNDLKKRDTAHANFTGADLSQLDLRNKNFENANFTNARLQDANFSASNLKDTTFHNVNLSNAPFNNANLIGADFKNANLEGAKFINATVDNKTRIIFSNLKYSIFANVRNKTTGNNDLRKVISIGNNHEGINLSHHIITGSPIKNGHLRYTTIDTYPSATYDGSDLTGAVIFLDPNEPIQEIRNSFRGANLTDAKFELREGHSIRMVPSFMDKDDHSPADFTNAILTNTDLSKCMLKDSYMGGLLGERKAKFTNSKYYTYPPQLPSGHSTFSLGIQKE